MSQKEFSKEISPKCEFTKCKEDAEYFIEFSSEVSKSDLKYFCEHHHNLLKENKNNIVIRGSEVLIQ